MREGVIAVVVVLGATIGMWLATQVMALVLLAALATYAVVMHCPPYDLAGDFMRWRRGLSERWIVVSRRTVFDQPLSQLP